MKRIRLTAIEIEALLAAAGNTDPAMWEDEATEKEGDRMEEAFERGMGKLQAMLAKREANRGR